MKRLASFGVVVAAVFAIADGAWPATGPSSPREVNITSDSARGWLPSEDLERQGRKAALDFFAAKDGGRYEDAYALLDQRNRRAQSLADYSNRLRQFNALAGAVAERRIVKVTWTKDPASAPAPGVYAAIDFAGRFANVDRYCGYVVLYQAPNGGDFDVMREEDAFLDNAAAKTIEQQHSRAEVDAAWSKASAYCPNYPGDRASQPATVTAPPLAPLPEQPNSSIGYPNVAAALADLRAKAGVVMSSQQGWTIASDETAKSFWSFPPAGNPAYPAAVKRQVVEKDGAVSLDMNVLCEATKAACDDLVRSFQQLNARMEAHLRQHH